MNESLHSMVLGPSVLYVVAGIALLITIVRRVEKPDAVRCNRFVQLFLLGISCQYIHFLEEFLTGFHIRFPALLDLAPWSSEFFVTFNLVWIALWLLSAIGIYNHFQPAYFPVWFFTLAMIGNGIFHPLLAIITQDYFPGLVTSPIVGIIGIVLASRLWQLTSLDTKEMAEE